VTLYLSDSTEVLEAGTGRLMGKSRPAKRRGKLSDWH